MPTIPTITSRISANALDAGARLPQSNGGARLQGNNALGRTLESVADVARSIGNDFAELADTQLKTTVANEYAKSTYSEREVALQQQAPLDGAGFAKLASDDYDAFITERTNGVEDPRAREALRLKLQADKPDIMARAASTQHKLAQANIVAQTNDSLTFLYNSVRSNPNDYEGLRTRLDLVVDGVSGWNETQRASARNEARQQLSRRMFEGLVGSANSPAELDALTSRLRGNDTSGRDWRAEMKPEDYDRVLDGITTRRTALASKGDTDTRATLGDLESRSKFTLIPETEVATAMQQAKQSGNIGLVTRAARVARNQDLLRTYGKATPEQIEAQADRITGAGASYPGLPTPVADAINEASAATGISAAYLGALTTREYGGEYAKGLKNGAVDYGVQASTSSATGVYQFIESTWTGLMRDGVTAKRFGVNVDGKSDDELLALRKDPRLSTLFAAVLAEQNKAQLESTLKRPVDESEVYLAHVLGAGGAATIIRGLTANPNGNADALMPDAAAANKSLFYADKGKGAPLTVREVHDKMTGGFSTEVSKVGFGDQEYLRGLAADMRKQRDADLMTFARNAGTFAVPQIDANGQLDGEQFKTLGRAASSAAAYYSVSRDEVKPLPSDLADGLRRRIERAPADEVISVFKAINQMGPDMAKQALKQIGTGSDNLSVFTYAAGHPDAKTGEAIIRGRKRLTDDPPDQAKLGTTNDDVSSQFQKITSGVLSDVSPAVARSIQDSALAMYVSNGYDGKFDKSKYEDAVHAVLGGKGVLGRVNGAATIAPPGTTAYEMQRALPRMGDADWINASPQKTMPRYRRGDVVPSAVLADEAQFVPIGRGMYKVKVENGFLLAAPNVPYVVALDADKINEFVKRNDPRNAVMPDMAPIGLQGFDSNGDWTGAR